MMENKAKPSAEEDFPRYGDVYDVNLDPVIGSETGKRRPALIVSNDTNNEFSETVTILPITGQPGSKQYPFEVLVSGSIAGLTLNSRIKANQICTVDKRRLVNFRGSLPLPYIKQAEKAIKIHLNMKRD